MALIKISETLHEQIKNGYWSNGKHSKNILTLKVWKVRIELWREL